MSTKIDLLRQAESISAPSQDGKVFTLDSGDPSGFTFDTISELGVRNTPFTATVGFADADYICDGTADNVQIQAAIDFVSGLGGGTVYIKPGNYAIADNVFPATNVLIYGSGNSTFFTLATAKGIRFDTVSNSLIYGVAIDGSAHASSNNFGILVRNSTNVDVEKCYLQNMNSFGVFIDATNSNTCSKIRINQNYIQGNGFSDVIGGGPQNSTGAVVSDVRVTNNFVSQDCTINGYQNAFDLVAATRVTVENNDFQGYIQFGTEQFPHLNSSFLNNTVRPAVGKTNTVILVTAKLTSTLSAQGINISGNTLYQGGIKMTGISGFKIKDVNINNNTILSTGILNGMELTYVQDATITGNVISGATAAIALTNCDTFAIDVNEMRNCQYGVRDFTGVDTIIIGTTNVYSSISVANTVGGNPGINIDIPDATNVVGLTVTQEDSTNNLNAVTVTNKGSGKGVSVTQQNSTGNGIQVRTSGLTAFSGTGDSSLAFIFGGNTTDTGQLVQVRNQGTGNTFQIRNSATTSTGHGLDVIHSGNTGTAQVITRSGDSAGAIGALSILSTNSGGGNAYALIASSGLSGFGTASPTSVLHTTSFATGYTAQTSNYAISATDYTVNCTSGTFTATLPTAVGIIGRQYVIKNSGTGVITLATTSTQTIDGAATQSLISQYDSITVQSNGANWIII